jgi:hypothetical protein
MSINTNVRRSIYLLMLVILSLGLGSAEAAPRPNVVFILADDKAASAALSGCFVRGVTVFLGISAKLHLAAIAGDNVRFSGINYTLLQFRRLDGRGLLDIHWQLHWREISANLSSPSSAVMLVV